MISGERWISFPGASAAAVQRLRELIPVQLPESFYELLLWSNGGHGSIVDDPFHAELYNVEAMIEEFSHDTPTRDNFPTFVPFGTAAGSDCLVFDTFSGPPYPILCSDLIANREESFTVAPDFDSFLRMLGHPNEHDLERDRLYPDE